MRKLPFWMFVAAAVLSVFAACKKVEMQPLEQNVMLPLAVGNRWVYTDSFISTTSLPSADTTVTQVSYEVARARWIDRLVVDAKGKKQLERLQAWEINPSLGSRGPFTILVLGDTVYSNASNTMFYRIADYGCNRISGSLEQASSYLRLSAIDGTMRPLICRPKQVGDKVATFPAFHDRAECTNVGPRDYQTANYLMLFYALEVSNLAESVTTEAGTFTCINLGSQWWAEGVGMVQSYHEGETSFYDHNNHLQTGLLRWKRSLQSYVVH